MIPIFPLGFSFLNIICLSCLCHGKFCTLLKSSQFCWIYYFRFAVIVFKNCMYCYSLWGISVFTEKSAVSFLLQLSIYILYYIYLSVLIMLKGFSFLVLFICCSWGGCYAQMSLSLVCGHSIYEHAEDIHAIDLVSLSYMLIIKSLCI